MIVLFHRMGRPETAFGLLGSALLTVGVLRTGSYFQPWPVVLPIGLGALIVMARAQFSRDDARLALTAVAFSALWLGLGARSDTLGRAASLSSAAVAAVAGYLLARRMPARSAEVTAAALQTASAGIAVISLVGWRTNTYPWAMEFDGVARLAGPFEYPNAAGAFYALALIAVASTRRGPVWERVLLAAPLVLALGATGSRGALFAAGFGLTLVVVRRQRARYAGIALAAGIGLTVVATVAIAAGAGRLDTASASDRRAEWRAALDAGLASPLFGSGPEEDLAIRNFRGDAIARFAHNEVLQVFAGAGIVGTGLLLTLIAVLAFHVRNREALPVATPVLIAGLIDFAWHFPAYVAWAGLLIGFAARREPERDTAPAERAGAAATS